MRLSPSVAAAFSGSLAGDLRPWPGDSRQSTAPASAPGSGGPGCQQELTGGGRRGRSAALSNWVGSVVERSGDVVLSGGTNRVGTVFWLRQMHGAEVLAVGRGAIGAGASGGGGRRGPVRDTCAGQGDGLVSCDPAIAVCVLVADCAPVALAGDNGAFAAVHAGWRGLVAGVIPRATDALRALGADEVVGAVGPCIHPECYAFSADDLGILTDAFGSRVAGRTATGEPALDLPAAVSVSLASSGVRQLDGVDACTSCSTGLFSHRARKDAGRLAMLVWMAPSGKSACGR
ncbi:MAG: laccase domain-containing protein [Acidimicrobiales bacterium]